jgi:hypothetical protein
MVSLVAWGLWVHLICIMYKANADGKLLVGGNIPTTDQISRSVGDDCSVALKELQLARVYELKDGAIYHAGVAEQLKKMNDRLSGYKRRDEAKMGHRSSIDRPSIVNGLGYNNNNNKNKKVRENGAQVRPTLAQWNEYAKSIGWVGKDVQGAFDHYEANGWKVGGRAPVKDWQAAARNCFRRNQQPKGTQTMQPKPQIRSSCESAPLYRIMGFASFGEWVKAGSPS